MVAPRLGISFSNEWFLASVGTWALFVARILSLVNGGDGGGIEARYDGGLLFVKSYSGVRVVGCFGSS